MTYTMCVFVINATRFVLSELHWHIETVFKYVKLLLPPICGSNRQHGLSALIY